MLGMINNHHRMVPFDWSKCIVYFVLLSRPSFLLRSVVFVSGLHIEPLQWCNVVVSQAKDFSMNRIHLTRNVFIIYAKTLKRSEMLSDSFSFFRMPKRIVFFNAIETSSIFRMNKIQNMGAQKSFVVLILSIHKDS